MLIDTRFGLNLSTLLWIEKDGDVVGGEGAFAGCRASANDSLVIFAGDKAVSQLTGNRVQAGSGVSHDEPGLTRARVAGAHGAGLASVVGGFGDAHSRLCNDAGDGALLLIDRKDFYGAGEVFYGVQLVVARDDRDADGVDVGIEEIGAMVGGVHPEIVDDDRAGSFSYVF